MLQTIDRALTLLVDMEADGQIEFLQGLTENQREMVKVETKCKSVILMALKNLSSGRSIDTILTSAAAECNAIQKNHALLLTEKSYFLSAMLYVIIVKLQQQSPDNNNIVPEMVTKITIENIDHPLRVLTAEEAAQITPSPDTHYVMALIVFSCRRKDACTIS